MKLNKIAEPPTRKVENDVKECTSNLPDPVALDFSTEIHEHLVLAESSRASALWLLEKAAEAMRDRKALHPMLGNYLADAFELALAKPATHQARALTDELHLSSQSRRPVHSWLVVGKRMQSLVADGLSKTKAKVIVAVEYSIDERTALEYFKKYSQARQKHNNSIE